MDFQVMNSFSIVITTFDKRFDAFLKPLIKQIKEQKPKIEVIVMINGPILEKFNENYRNDILAFLSEYEAVYPSIFPKFQSLAKIWNRGILNATHEYSLVLNDDVVLQKNTNTSFLDGVQELLSINQTTFTINGSFSHFVISKTELMEVGFFDERLLGLGEEDGDFFWRYHENYKHEILNIEIPLIENVHSDLRDEGYKKGIRTASLFNREFILKQKYQSVMLGGYRGMFDKKVKKILPDQEQYPYESFYLNNIDKL